MRVFLIAILLFPITALSLDFNDKLKANIKTIYEANYIRVSRGLEDGIGKGDVARMLTKSKAIGKGICTISTKTYSIWFIFKSYTKFSKIEPLMLYYRGNESVPIKNRLLVESDLRILHSDKIKNKIVRVEDINPDGYLYSDRYGQNEVIDLTKTKYFDKLGWRIRAEASPLMMASDSKESNYAFGGAIERTGVHNISVSAEQSSHTSENQYTGEVSQNTRTKGSLQYEIRDFYAPKYSYLGYLDYDNKLEQTFSPVEHHAVFSVFGIKKHISVKHTNVTAISVSYAPSFDYLLRDRMFEKTISNESETVFRHAFKLNAVFRLYEDQVWLHESLNFMPRQEISNLGIDFLDSNVSNKLRLEVKLGKYFGLNYVNELLWNKRLNVTGEGSQTALRQTISFRFDAAL